MDEDEDYANRCQVDEDEAYEDFCDALFYRDKQALRKIVYENRDDEGKMLDKLFHLLQEARSEGKYPAGVAV